MIAGQLLQLLAKYSEGCYNDVFYIIYHTYFNISSLFSFKFLPILSFLKIYFKSIRMRLKIVTTNRMALETIKMSQNHHFAAGVFIINPYPSSFVTLHTYFIFCNFPMKVCIKDGYTRCPEAGPVIFRVTRAARVSVVPFTRFFALDATRLICSFGPCATSTVLSSITLIFSC